jgi:hypothetical protein
MTPAPLIFAATLLLGPPTGEPAEPVISPTQPQPGEPAIAPAQIDAERALTEPGPLPSAEQPDPAQPDPAQPDPEPDPDYVQPDPLPDALPSWEDPHDFESPFTGPPLGGYGAPPPERPPAKGAAFFVPAGVLFGVMITTQIVTATACEDAYCGSRGTPWRLMGLGVVGLAGAGGWLQGNHDAWRNARAAAPVKSLVGRRAAGWTMFALGVAGMIADTTLYMLCYDGARGPYTELEGFRYTCSPTISVVTLDLSTLVGATGLGLALSAESQLRNRAKFELSVAPWAGRGQAGLSLGGRF